MESALEDVISPYMKHDEKLLWEGVSERGFRWRLGELIAIALGLAFITGPLLALFGGAKGWLWLVRLRR